MKKLYYYDLFVLITSVLEVNKTPFNISVTFFLNDTFKFYQFNS